MNPEQNIEIILENEELWKKFSDHMTEMLIARTGRKLFPKIYVKIRRLNPEIRYGLTVRLERVDDLKFRYGAKDWRKAGKSNTIYNSRPVWHPDVRLGSEWMEQEKISFDHLKVTNDSNNQSPNMVYLHSQHMYYPVVEVYEINSSISTSKDIVSGMCKEYLKLMEQDFKNAAFVAVTNYHNEKIKELKSRYNPYAHERKPQWPAMTENKIRRPPSTASSESSESNTSSLTEPYPVPEMPLSQSPPAWTGSSNVMSTMMNTMMMNQMYLQAMMPYMMTTQQQMPMLNPAMNPLMFMPFLNPMAMNFQPEQPKKEEDKDKEEEHIKVEL